MSEERLQKVLARAGEGSRRQIEEFIREGRISVNGQVASLGAKVDLTRDAVRIDGRRIQPPSAIRRYLLLNKPSGHVSTLSDPEGRPTVLDLVPERLRKGLVAVGRLDYDSEGLLLLTDDGDFAHRVAHPRFGCTKTYEVKVKGAPKASALERLRGGMVIDGRRVSVFEIEPKTKVAGARPAVQSTWWTVVLGEGRNRQLREMFHRIGHPVRRLRRVAIGPLKDPHLPPGTLRELDGEEVEALRQARPGKKKAAKARPAQARQAKTRSARTGKESSSKTPASRAGRSSGDGAGGRGGRGPGGARSTGSSSRRGGPKGAGGRNRPGGRGGGPKGRGGGGRRG